MGPKIGFCFFLVAYRQVLKDFEKHIPIVSNAVELLKGYLEVQ